MAERQESKFTLKQLIKKHGSKRQKYYGGY